MAHPEAKSALLVDAQSLETAHNRSILSHLLRIQLREFCPHGDHLAIKILHEDTLLAKCSAASLYHPSELRCVSPRTRDSQDG